MNKELLKAFLAVAENGGFSAAAGALHCTQSAVSLKIKRLEEETGTPLFERTSRSVALTEAGGILRAYARQILHLHEEANVAISTASHGPSLRFGISEEQAVCYLPDILPSFTRRCPNIRLEVYCDQSYILSQRLADGLLDFALVIRHRNTTDATLIGHEPLVWAASQDFVADENQPLPLALNPEGCVYRARALAALTAAGRDWNVNVTSQSPVGINMAVQSGLAVTVKAPRSVPEHCRVLDTRHNMPDLGDIEVEMQRAVTALSPAADEFERILRNTLAASQWLRAVSATA